MIWQKSINKDSIVKLFEKSFVKVKVKHVSFYIERAPPSNLSLRNSDWREKYG